MNISGVSTTGTFYDSIRKTDRAGGVARGEGTSGRQAGEKLTPDEQAEVRKLKERDREVRAHEAAHMAAGAGMTTGASFTYQRGPDGVSYAVGGEVGISTSRGRTPDETIEKARQIRAAALAPADPSGQDRAVAAVAAAMEQEAQARKIQERAEEASASEAPESSAVANAYGAGGDRVGKMLDIYA